jgi:hypothetical protein
MAENMDTQLKQMSEDLKEIIEHLNETNQTQDTSDPVSLPQITSVKCYLATCAETAFCPTEISQFIDVSSRMKLLMSSSFSFCIFIHCFVNLPSFSPPSP